jgi:hypothetical protein
MGDAVEASAQRIRDHLRRPLPGSRDLLMETAGNTVSATDPPAQELRRFATTSGIMRVDGKVTSRPVV